MTFKPSELPDAPWYETHSPNYLPPIVFSSKAFAESVKALGVTVRPLQYLHAPDAAEHWRARAIAAEEQLLRFNSKIRLEVVK